MSDCPKKQQSKQKGSVWELYRKQYERNALLLDAKCRLRKRVEALERQAKKSSRQNDMDCCCQPSIPKKSKNACDGAMTNDCSCPRCLAKCKKEKESEDNLLCGCSITNEDLCKSDDPFELTFNMSNSKFQKESRSSGLLFDKESSGSIPICDPPKCPNKEACHKDLPPCICQKQSEPKTQSKLRSLPMPPSKPQHKSHCERKDLEREKKDSLNDNRNKSSCGKESCCGKSRKKSSCNELLGKRQRSYPREKCSDKKSEKPACEREVAYGSKSVCSKESSYDNGLPCDMKPLSDNGLYGGKISSCGKETTTNRKSLFREEENPASVFNSNQRFLLGYTPCIEDHPRSSGNIISDSSNKSKRKSSCNDLVGKQKRSCAEDQSCDNKSSRRKRSSSGNRSCKKETDFAKENSCGKKSSYENASLLEKFGCSNECERKPSPDHAEQLQTMIRNQSKLKIEKCRLEAREQTFISKLKEADYKIQENHNHQIAGDSIKNESNVGLNQLCAELKELKSRYNMERCRAMKLQDHLKLTVEDNKEKEGELQQMVNIMCCKLNGLIANNNELKAIVLHLDEKSKKLEKDLMQQKLCEAGKIKQIRECLQRAREGKAHPDCECCGSGKSVGLDCNIKPPQSVPPCPPVIPCIPCIPCSCQHSDESWGVCADCKKLIAGESDVQAAPEISEPEETEPEVPAPEEPQPEVLEPEEPQPEVPEPEVPEIPEAEVTEAEVPEPGICEPIAFDIETGECQTAEPPVCGESKEESTQEPSGEPIIEPIEEPMEELPAETIETCTEELLVCEQAEGECPEFGETAIECTTEEADLGVECEPVCEEAAIDACFEEKEACEEIILKVEECAADVTPECEEVAVPVMECPAKECEAAIECPDAGTETCEPECEEAVAECEPQIEDECEATECPELECEEVQACEPTKEAEAESAPPYVDEAVFEKPMVDELIAPEAPVDDYAEAPIEEAFAEQMAEPICEEEAVGEECPQVECEAEAEVPCDEVAVDTEPCPEEEIAVETEPELEPSVEEEVQAISPQEERAVEAEMPVDSTYSEVVPEIEETAIECEPSIVIEEPVTSEKLIGPEEPIFLEEPVTSEKLISSEEPIDLEEPIIPEVAPEEPTVSIPHLICRCIQCDIGCKAVCVQREDCPQKMID